jgi:pyruvate dehydrogenase E1 component beta subunit
MVFASVARTHRVVIVHEAVSRSGWVRRSRPVSEDLDELDAPIVRWARPSCPFVRKVA